MINMQINEQLIELKNSKMCVLRSTEIKDAKKLIDHIRLTSEETDYMGRYAEEITISEDEQAQKISVEIGSPRSISICAVVDGKIVAHGVIGCIRENLKYLHRAWFGISIQRAYWGLHIGTLIMSNLKKEAVKMGYEQMELDVVTENKRAVKLYEKMGFEIMGIRPRSFKLKDGLYQDEYMMVCRL